MKKFLIETEQRERSEILVEKGIFSEIKDGVGFVFTDTNVLALYGEGIKNQFPGVPVWAMPAGEQNKTQDTLFALLGEMKKAELTRKSTLICIGGGVVGDIGGLASALYMRGIDCIQVPTTLLSQVDSSVGGKTAIDFCGVKNLIGAFSQAKKVYVDSNFLKTLPEREIRCGLGEIIKHGALNEELFELLWANQTRLFDLDFIDGIIAKNIDIKAEVVRSDYKEGQARKCLNLAHTTAHAFELSDGALSHGEYVLIGMLYEAEIAKNCVKNVDVEYLARLETLTKTALGDLPAMPSAEQAAHRARLDKKNTTSGRVSLVVPVRCGKYAFLELDCREYAELLEEIGGKLC